MDASCWLSAFWAIALIPICADVLFMISNLIITQAFRDDTQDTAQLMDGYRAAVWVCFAASLVALCIVGVGLRRIGKVGLKRE